MTARVPTPVFGSSAVGDQRMAAIDIGSNSIRQIVADVSPAGQIRVVDEMKAMPRLGEGLERTGALGQTGVDAALAAIQRMLPTSLDEALQELATSAAANPPFVWPSVMMVVALQKLWAEEVNGFLLEGPCNEG